MFVKSNQVKPDCVTAGIHLLVFPIPFHMWRFQSKICFLLKFLLLTQLLFFGHLSPWLWSLHPHWFRPHPNKIHLLPFLCKQWSCPLIHPTEFHLAKNLLHLIPHFHIPNLSPNTLFLSPIHLWSHFSASLGTSDPSFSTHPYVVIPALSTAERHIPVCELLLQEPACVVAPGQGWHRPAGMRRNRFWAFLDKRTIKPTAVHNELILIQVRCTSCFFPSFCLQFFSWLLHAFIYLLPINLALNHQFKHTDW